MKIVLQILAAVIGAAIVGGGTYITNKVFTIEKTITKHHGAEWAEIGRIIDATQMNTSVKELSKEVNAIIKWTKNRDIEISKRAVRREKPVEGFAKKTDDYADTNEKAVIMNNKHWRTRHFDIGHEIEIKNKANSEAITAKIEKKVEDLGERDTLIWLNQTAARALNFNRGDKIEVSVINKTPVPREKWMSVDDILRSQQ
jgi:formylmethanofuran dehydrogenase subunit D